MEAPPWPLTSHPIANRPAWAAFGDLLVARLRDRLAARRGAQRRLRERHAA